MSSQAPQDRPPSLSPRDIITQGIASNSPAQISAGLEAFEQSRRGLTDANLDWAVNLAVKRAKPDMVKYLIEEKGANVEGVSSRSVGTAAREEGVLVEDVVRVLEMLVRRGWDVNGTADNAPPLILEICRSEPLLRWCLSHGARVDVEPSITEEVASHGSLESLKLVLEHKAPLGQRTLHRAVQSAAYAPSANEGEDVEAGGGKKVERMLIVRYLVEEVGVSVDGMDVEEGQQRPNHWGVPMAYAVPAGQGEGEGDGGEGVVRWLLEKGANPHIKDCWGLYDVYGLAERMKNEKVLAVLNEWKERQGKGMEAGKG